MNEKIITKKLDYNIKLNEFEGPLDLLLFLITKNKMDIMDISLSQLTDEYIKYIEDNAKNGIEVSSEFLVIASNLVKLKSKKLLPILKDEEVIDEEELLELLIQYKNYKRLSLEVNKLYGNNFGKFFRQMENFKFKKNIEICKLKVDKEEMFDIYINILEKKQNKINKFSKNVNNIIVKDNFTVKNKMKQILNYLNKNNTMNFTKFYIKDYNKKEIVTAIISTLDLAKSNKIKITQNYKFSDIFLKYK